MHGSITAWPQHAACALQVVPEGVGAGRGVSFTTTHAACRACEAGRWASGGRQLRYKVWTLAKGAA